ncbi:DUF2285 domain-containing protein [Paenirhodobacter populi]|uniref:DUF2285 domain-containing protein n=1 Tax=Paenirhodobacter populi TaxID=2306993 RepID=UPI001F4FDFEA|nr:DUF2285 domain-containing protein [Sinirhodobacter populi]
MYDFPRDPNIPPGRDPPFWSPDLFPEALLLALSQWGGGEAAAPVTLTQLIGLELRRVGTEWHGLWSPGGPRHQFWLTEAPPGAAADFVVILPLDALFELRAHAARRIWRALNGRNPDPVFHDMPPRLREFHTLSVRALDARQHGESYRTIAEVLLGFRGDKTDWENDPCRNRVRRLVAHADQMMRGGYRALLHYPIRLHAQRR